MTDDRIWLDDHPTEYRPLWWQKRGLSYTRSGYGSKIPTARMVFYAGRWRRVYVTIFSNIGTAWITVNGVRHVVG